MSPPILYEKERCVLPSSSLSTLNFHSSLICQLFWTFSLPPSNRSKLRITVVVPDFAIIITSDIMLKSSASTCNVYSSLCKATQQFFDSLDWNRKVDVVTIHISGSYQCDKISYYHRMLWRASNVAIFIRRCLWVLVSYNDPPSVACWDDGTSSIRTMFMFNLRN